MQPFVNLESNEFPYKLETSAIQVCIFCSEFTVVGTLLNDFAEDVIILVFGLEACITPGVNGSIGKDDIAKVDILFSNSGFELEREFSLLDGTLHSPEGVAAGFEESLSFLVLLGFVQTLVSAGKLEWETCAALLIPSHLSADLLSHRRHVQTFQFTDF